MAGLAHSGEADYVYDHQNRLQEIRLPDSSLIVYSYTDEPGKPSTQTTTYHPSPVDRPALQQPSTDQPVPVELQAQFRPVAENSDQNMAVLSFQKHEGQLYSKFGGRAEMSINTDMKNDLDLIFGTKPGNPQARQAAEQSLRGLLSDVATDGRTVIVWTPGEPYGDQLALFLTREMGARAVFTDNVQRARENLSKHRPVGGNTGVTVIDETMVEIQRQAIFDELSRMRFPQEKIAHSLREMPGDSNIIIVVAENNPQARETFLSQLKAAGESGKLKDKFLVLQACSDRKSEMANRTREMMIQYGAVGVHYYAKTIPVKGVGIILREAYKLMQENSDLKADEVFRKSIQRIIDGMDRGDPAYKDYRHLKRQLEDMLNNFTFVHRPPKYRQQPGGHPSVWTVEMKAA